MFQPKWIVSFLILSATFAFPQNSLSPTTKGAVLYADGDVAVNGIAVLDMIAVFVGDRIWVGEKSTAAIVSLGSVSYIPANTSVEFGKMAPLSGSSSSALATQLVTTNSPSNCPHPSRNPGKKCAISKTQP
jgi:hypothetical protein